MAGQQVRRFRPSGDCLLLLFRMAAIRFTAASEALSSALACEQRLGELRPAGIRAPSDAPNWGHAGDLRRHPFVLLAITPQGDAALAGPP